MMPGSVKAVSHKFDMANAQSISPTVARVPPPRTGNLFGLFVSWRSRLGWVFGLFEWGGCLVVLGYSNGSRSTGFGWKVTHEGSRRQEGGRGASHIAVRPADNAHKADRMRKLFLAAPADTDSSPEQHWRRQEEEIEARERMGPFRPSLAVTSLENGPARPTRGLFACTSCPNTSEKGDT